MKELTVNGRPLHAIGIVNLKVNYMEELVLKINEKEFITNYNKNNSSAIVVNGTPYNVELLRRLSDKTFVFTVNQKLCRIELDFNQPGMGFVTIDGLAFEIEITDETKKLLQTYINNSEKTDLTSAKIVKAPMPGMIIKLLVIEGQTISKDDKLLIIESMKMENIIKSPISGTIGRIYISESNPVEKDARLVEIVP